MAKQLEPKVLKHQQHLKLQKEAEEESWISGEELRTDGSSDEESQKNYKTHKKVKSRRKSEEKKDDALNAVTAKLTEESAKEDSQLSEMYASEEGATSVSMSWRPKRGSIKLPNLYEGFLDEEGVEILTSDDSYKNEPNVFKSLPVLRSQDIRNITNYNNELVAVIGSINRLEERFAENMKRLEDEKRKRLKIEEEMCFQICNDDKFCDKNATLFLNLCGFEGNIEDSADNDHTPCHEYNDSQQNKKCRTMKSNNSFKNFIQRNVELAATAMSKLPLTDEEKQQLERILSDIDLSDAPEQEDDCSKSAAEETGEKRNNGIENEQIVQRNGFHLSETDKQRLDEIDFELQNKFSETQNFKSSNNEGTDNFWKNLVLDEMLKNIDHKLTLLRNEDHTEMSEMP